MPCGLPEGLLERLSTAERWMVLTGSGVSADSGVPTFREAQTGLWARYDALALATPEAFLDNPGRVWAWYEWRRGLVTRAEPNAAHFAIAELATCVGQLTLVTQNVDGLHQRAGSADVVEFHGNLTRDRCFGCDLVPQDAPVARDGPPVCAACGGLLRPDVVWFGETIPAAALSAAAEAAASAELFLSVGTSALVYPAAGLAGAAAAAGATLVEINAERTPLSEGADYVLDGTAAKWLPAIVAGVRESRARHRPGPP